jgi:hypothetical protein
LKIYKLIYRVGIIKSRSAIIQQYGKPFYKKFCITSKCWLDKVIAKTPDIGNTIFSFNYAFTPAYIAWFKAAIELDLPKEQADKLLWMINERIFSLIPKKIAPLFINRYLNNFRKKAPVHQSLSEQNSIHPYDYKITYQEINSRVFEIDIYECGMMKLAKDFDALGMFPSICRIDYLLSNYMGAGFERTKTLGDGDNCCNCRYTFGGTCEWSPEKGFIDRK